MPGAQRDISRFVRTTLERRRHDAELNAGQLASPLFVYSYSSRNFPDLAPRYDATVHMVPIHLISLYDIHHGLVHPIERVEGATRFLDSGRYEVDQYTDWLGEDGDAGSLAWTPELYVESARSALRDGDVLVSFDDRTIPIVEQVRQSLGLYRKVEVQRFQRDLLLHPNGEAPASVAQALKQSDDMVDIIGLTEKDLGPPWYVSVIYVQQLDIEVRRQLGRHIPIHIFGCFDPQTIPYLYFAGADVFDGLAWMRYYFRAGHSYYAKEFEYAAPPEQIVNTETMLTNLLSSNVEELERLRADLQYTVLTGDFARFEKCFHDLAAFELNV